MSDQWPVGTTASDYLDFVWQAVTTTNAFASFRRNPRYTPVLEHVSDALGREYMDLITDPLIRDICLGSEYADTVGSPRVAEFLGRKISPTTLRYGKILQDLVDAFPGLPNMHSIIEIGVGYGGQARLISEYVRLKGGRLDTYYLVDLLPVLHLSRLYLDHFSLVFQVDYVTKSELRLAGSYDLAISSYAFSEFTRSLQRQYLDRVLLRSRGGYLTMNTGLRGDSALVSTAGAHCHSAEELMPMLPNSVVLEENPRSGRNNYVLIFGQQNVLQPSTLAALRLASDRASA
jgi:hypothetical protein